LTSWYAFLRVQERILVWPHEVSHEVREPVLALHLRLCPPVGDVHARGNEFSDGLQSLEENRHGFSREIADRLALAPALGVPVRRFLQSVGYANVVHDHTACLTGKDPVDAGDGLDQPMTL